MKKFDGLKKLKTIVITALCVASALMLYKGAEFFFATTGFVRGSEFGMLITIVNQISLIMIWLALFAMWKLLTGLPEKPESE